MKNITLSAEERLIEAARERARAENTTLERAVPPLAGRAMPTRREPACSATTTLMPALARPGSRSDANSRRDEMNER